MWCTLQWTKLCAHCNSPGSEGQRRVWLWTKTVLYWLPFQALSQIGVGVFSSLYSISPVFFWGHLDGTREWHNDGQRLGLGHPTSWEGLCNSYPAGSFELSWDLGLWGTLCPLQHPFLPQPPYSSFLSPSSSSGCAGVCGERSRISAKYKPGCSSFQIEQRSRVLSWFL